MTWNLIAMPAAEELACGYTPSPFSGHDDASASRRPFRRFLTAVTVLMALIAGAQLTLSDSGESGQRRIAELNLTERKSECRNCDLQIVSDAP